MGLITQEEQPFYFVIENGVLKEFTCNKYWGQSDGVVVPSGVTEIGRSAFGAVLGVVSVVLPDTVKVIRDFAFSECSRLVSINIPDSVTEIGEHAFSGCKSLRLINIPDSVTSIGASAFYECSSLTLEVDEKNPSYCVVNNVLFSKDKTLLHTYHGSRNNKEYAIPDSVTTIGVNAFAHSGGHLESVTLPNSVTTIGSGAFFECGHLASINIPYSVTSIGDSAFSYCSSLTLEVDEKNQSYCVVNNVLFSKDKTLLHTYIGSKADKVYIVSNTVKEIEAYAFAGCKHLASIDIPDSVVSIGVYAFHGCSSLEAIVIPDSVTSIGERAFSFCSALAFVTIQNGLTSIGNGAFYCCESLKLFTLPRCLKGKVNFIPGKCKIKWTR